MDELDKARKDLSSIAKLREELDRLTRLVFASHRLHRERLDHDAVIHPDGKRKNPDGTK